MTRLIPISKPDLSGNELKYVTECVRTGWISSLGKYVTMFEQTFAQWCGTTEGVATMNGTVALHLALHALGIGPGDEVLVPTLTFIASANAIVYTGATPVFVDSEYETWNLAPADVEQKITSRTKAIMPVHLFGHPAKMDEIMDIANRHDLLVIEDAAEAHGAEVHGKRVGSRGHAACFSFFGNKIMTTGEGGMICTSDSQLAARMRILRDHAMTKEKRYWHDEVGFNYRMTNLQAAVGLAQVERADWLLARKRQVAEHYTAQLRDVPGLTLPSEASWARHAYWLFSMLVDEREFGCNRDALMGRLHAAQVESRRFFYPLHTLPVYQRDERYPVAEDLGDRGLNLPSSVRMRNEDIDRICEAIRTIGYEARAAGGAQG